MKSYLKSLTLSIISLLFISSSSTAGELFKVSQKLWQLAQDNVYLQEVAQKIPTDNPVISLSVYEGQCYANINGNIHILKDGSLNQMKSAPSGVKRPAGSRRRSWAGARECESAYRDLQHNHPGASLNRQ